MTCTHPRIITYHDADTGLPVQLWACAECGRRFEPLRLNDEALLRQALHALVGSLENPNWAVAHGDTVAAITAIRARLLTGYGASPVGNHTEKS